MKLFSNIRQAFQIAKKTVQYTYMGNYGNPYWRTETDIEYVQEAYKKIVWAYSCVALIASAASSIDYCLYRNKLGNKYKVEDHPILNMLNIKMNDYTTSKDFFDMWSTYLATEGKFWAVFNSPVYPTSMEFLYPHFTRPIPELDGFISGAEYSVDGKKYTYDKDILMWSKFFDPENAYSSLSPIRAMARTVDTENEAVDWNKNTFENAGVPPGAFQVQNPSPELQKNLRKEWKKNYAGNKNARMPLILNAEKASYQNFGLSPIDMDFLEQRKLNRIEICSGFGVPSQLVGDPQGQTYSNYRQAQASFWENTLIPRYITEIKDILNMTLCSKYDDNLTIEPNLDNCPAMVLNREIKINNVNEQWESGLIKRSEGRQQLGYEVTEEDEIYIEELRKDKEMDEADKNSKKKEEIYY